LKSKACFFAKKSPETLQRDSKEKIAAALNFGDLSNAALEQLQIYVNDVCNKRVFFSSITRILSRSFDLY